MRFRPLTTPEDFDGSDGWEYGGDAGYWRRDQPGSRAFVDICEINGDECLIGFFACDYWWNESAQIAEPGDLHPAGHPLPIHHFPKGTTPEEARREMKRYIERVGDLTDELVDAGWDDELALRWRHRNSGEVAYIVVDFERDEVRTNPRNVDAPN